METPLKQLVGERVASRRHHQGLTHEALSAKAHVAVVTLSRIEHGHFVPSIETLRALAVALHTTTDYLLGLSDTPTPPRRKPGTKRPTSVRV
jgi:transcriptional regulator with XRE-family HTH domain